MLVSVRININNVGMKHGKCGDEIAKCGDE